ncbi:uroporphyrinogen-III C-methyltransferase [Bacillus sp. 31A1R]|uniref:uroporphyrinogen-III C-methyltransferase n=1 Tax=Robertmurraya mangrovi TaxID=3098077 RepID=A0ABU5J0R1_9BACI|nr:uroporphyrinogen-III C-methyltransferase [Bacillus sp. 31A1R]MDZ5473010.1 uroporphyrinogen-III C-methyltransferase [Bacillus sp. 31A1R]
MKKGKAYLVGAGPGDIGLITVKGLEAIKKAEVILYDRLANPKLLDFASPHCEFIYCGKLPQRHHLRQENINELLVEKVMQGKIVVRLKGGDPGVFGRVGEEAEALAKESLPFEMVPGISSGIAAPLYAGIPVTHREYGESFAVVTAHDKSKDGKPSLDWEGLAKGVDTIAFYMGVANLPFICENLIKHGKSVETPVILIQWGTFGRQQTLEGTLSTIADLVKKEKFSNPAITLVGEIVKLREKISWFEKKPLYGRQILLARTGTNESALAKKLADEGADVIEFPKWKSERIKLDVEIMGQIESYEKILFTSPESVTDFFQSLLEYRMDVRKIKAYFYGLSSKSVKAINEKGFLAELASNMPHEGKLLIIGDSSIEKNKPNFTIEFGTGDFLITSEKTVDEQFVPIFKRMLEEATLNTMIFPSSGSVSMFVEEVVEKGILSKEEINQLEIHCYGEETYKMATMFGFMTQAVEGNRTNEEMVQSLKLV